MARKVRNASTRLVVCVRNDGYRTSLEVRKIYRVLADVEAEKNQLLCVIDESGEDYLYPSKFFLPLDLPQAARRAVLKAA